MDDDWTEPHQAQRQEPRQPRSGRVGQRPGTVTAAAVLLFIPSLLLGFLGISLFASSSGVRSSPLLFLPDAMLGVSDKMETAATVVTVLAAVMFLFGIFIMKGSAVARVLVVIAAVIGIVFWVAVLASIRDLDEEAVLIAGTIIGWQALMIGLLVNRPANDFFASRYT